MFKRTIYWLQIVAVAVIVGGGVAAGLAFAASGNPYAPCPMLKPMIGKTVGRCASGQVNSGLKVIVSGVTPFGGFRFEDLRPNGKLFKYNLAGTIGVVPASGVLVFAVNCMDSVTGLPLPPASYGLRVYDLVTYKVNGQVHPSRKITVKYTIDPAA